MKVNLKLMIAAALTATAVNSLGQSSVVPTNVINLGDRELLFGEPVELPWETSDAALRVATKWAERHLDETATRGRRGSPPTPALA
jgi:hypothetical protein